jgi:hypothetical protein
MHATSNDPSSSTRSCGPCRHARAATSSRPTTARTRPARSCSSPGRFRCLAFLDRAGPDRRRASAPQQRLPPTRRDPRRARAHGRWRQRGLSDRARARRNQWVHLAIGSRQAPLPQQLGRDLFSVLTATELMGKTVDSRLGRRLSGRDALIGSSPRAIRRQGVHVRPRAISAAGSTITFIDARPRDGHLGDGLRRQRFLHPLARLRRRRSCHPRARGVTAVPRLYFLGMPWQHNPRLRAHRLGQTRRPTHRRPDLEARIRPRRRPGPTTADGDGIADHLENS